MLTGGFEIDEDGRFTPHAVECVQIDAHAEPTRYCGEVYDGIR